MKHLILLLALAGSMVQAQVNNGRWMMQGSLSMGGYKKDPKPNNLTPFANFNMAINLQHGFSPAKNFVIGSRLGVGYDLLKTHFDSTIVISDNPPLSFDLETDIRTNTVRPNVGFFSRYFMPLGRERKHGPFVHFDLNYVPVIVRSENKTKVFGFSGTVKDETEAHTIVLNLGLGYTAFVGEYGIEFMLGLMNYTFDATNDTHNLGGIFNFNQWTPTIGIAHYYNYKKKAKRPQKE